MKLNILVCSNSTENNPLTRQIYLTAALETRAAVLAAGSRQPPTRLARPLAIKTPARLLQLGDRLLELLRCRAAAHADRRSMRQTPPLLVATRGLGCRCGLHRVQSGFCSWLKIFEVSDDKLSGCYYIKYHQVPAKMNGTQAFGIMRDKLGFRNKRYVPFVPVLKRQFTSKRE